MWTTDCSVDEIAVYIEFSQDTVAYTTSKDVTGHQASAFWKFKREDVDGWVGEGGAPLSPDELSEEERKDA